MVYYEMTLRLNQWALLMTIGNSFAAEYLIELAAVDSQAVVVAECIGHLTLLY